MSTFLEARAAFRTSNPQVATFPRATRCALLSVLALLMGLSATLDAAPQAASAAPPLSLDRIKKELARTPPPEFKSDMQLQVPVTFKSRVDQRVFVQTLEEALHKEFDLNEIQRQSANWRSQCCGYDLSQLFRMADKAMRERQIRKTREQIWRELMELEAAANAAKKKPAPVPADVKQP
jgi:uncharacterized protein YfcZ (UPF0381/DUF406 family)